MPRTPPQQPDTPGLLTSAQAAAFLAISERLLWTLANGGSIPRVLIGRAVRYDPADLRDWIDRQKVRGAALPASHGG